jgi:hypothetical protein
VIAQALELGHAVDPRDVLLAMRHDAERTRLRAATLTAGRSRRATSEAAQPG